MIIHVADPVAFFAPLNARDERLEDLAANPDWWFGRPGLPGFDEHPHQVIQRWSMIRPLSTQDRSPTQPSARGTPATAATVPGSGGSSGSCGHR